MMIKLFKKTILFLLVCTAPVFLHKPVAYSDTTPPSTPTSLQATAISSSQINLSWDASTGSGAPLYYRVYRDGKFISYSPTTSYLDIGVLPNTTYNYQVSAYEIIGDPLLSIKPESPLSEVVSIRTPSSPSANRLIYPQHLVYKGAFRLPRTAGMPRWGYGATAITYYPKGDPGGENDGYPGSLFGYGKNSDVDHTKVGMVSEVSIPRPVISKNLNELNVAETLQPFGDITGGFKDTLRALYWPDDSTVFGGLLYLPKQGEQTTDKIYWNIYEYYAVENPPELDYPTFGWSELDISNPQAQGAWHVGPYNSTNWIYHPKKTAYYMFEIPKEWADKNIGNKYIATGATGGPGVSLNSKGPSLYAIGPYNDGNPPVDGAELDAKILLMYPSETDYPSWTHNDNWNSGAWLTIGDRSAVMFVGRKGLGEKWYGVPREGDCGSDKGYHYDPYESQFLFYDPEELAAVARGEKDYSKVLPYFIFRPGDYFFPSCSGLLQGTAYDRERGIIYISQQYEEDKESILVYVFQLTEDDVGVAGYRLFLPLALRFTTGHLAFNPD